MNSLINAHALNTLFSMKEAVEKVLKEYDDDSVKLHTPIAYMRHFEELKELVAKCDKELEHKNRV